ncbi:MAG: response regulator transcription factor [Porphyromonas sp.]|nr:response regulator transcription factor [Porphyromonas sp.]
MTTTIRIAIAEPSPIIRLGLEAQLKKLPRCKALVTFVGDDLKRELTDALALVSADIFILNPLLCGLRPRTLLPQGSEAKVVALSYGTTDEALLKGYDAVLPITSSTQQLSALIDKFVDAEEDKAVVSQDLTSREREILVCVVKGMTNKQIAEQLFLSQHTVITHRRNIGQKLNIKSPSALTLYAMMHNLIQSSDINMHGKR